MRPSSITSNQTRPIEAARSASITTSREIARRVRIRAEKEIRTKRGGASRLAARSAPLGARALLRLSVDALRALPRPSVPRARHTRASPRWHSRKKKARSYRDAIELPRRHTRRPSSAPPSTNRPAGSSPPNRGERSRRGAMPANFQARSAGSRIRKWLSEYQNFCYSVISATGASRLQPTDRPGKGRQICRVDVF